MGARCTQDSPVDAPKRPTSRNIHNSFLAAEKCRRSKLRGIDERFDLKRKSLA